MKTLYLVNAGYKPQPQPTLNHAEWIKHEDFMNSISAWHIAPKAQAMQAVDSYEVMYICYEQLAGYCKVVGVHTVQCSAASEFDRVSNAMQRAQDKHRAKLAMYNSLLEHLAKQ